VPENQKNHGTNNSTTNSTFYNASIMEDKRISKKESSLNNDIHKTKKRKKTGSRDRGIG